MAVSPKASPIQTLRDHVTHLEAAITLCLADPKAKPVHLLRTTTRRIEAQLTLLSLLSHLPPHRKQAKKAQRLLKELRRAAGQVRDLDVQRDLIKDKTSAATQKESLQLRNALKDQRTQTEADLLQILDKHQSKLALTLESLLEALAPAERLSLTPTQLTHLTQSWFTRNIPSTYDDPDQLHTIRKTAKLARYIAETAPNSARTARKVAASFESLQQSGGEWHDWLILAAIAEDHLGKSSPLTQTFHRQCQTSLTTYRNHLHTFTPTPSTKKKRPRLAARPLV